MTAARRGNRESEVDGVERVICVVGSTASGKTKMGVALAKRFGGEVVSVDSMQIYRGMTIGTAAPTAQETEGVPHHMIGVADPQESWSGGGGGPRPTGYFMSAMHNKLRCRERS